MSKLIEVTDDTFEAQVLGSPVPVAVDFYNDTCRPCRMLKPMLEALADNLGNARIVTVDVSTNDRLIREHVIRAVPTLIVFRGGQEVSRIVGLAGLASLREALEE